METPGTAPESAADTGTPAHNKEILRLVELLHRVDTSEPKEVALQNLVGHLTKHFPGDVLPVMDRLSRWDTSGAAALFYARVALQKNQVKLAHKIVEPLLAASGAPESTLLLGSRILVRTGDLQRARQLLDRIPAGSPLEKGIKDVEGKIDAARARASSAPPPVLEARV